MKELKQFEFTAAQLPQFEEVLNSKEYVWYGDDNLWPSHSVNLFNNSAILRSCLVAKIQGVIGKNMLINGIDAKKMLVNSTESVYDVFKKTATDFVIHNGFSINTVLRRDREGISEFYHMDFTKLRSGKVNLFGRVNEYFYSSDWALLRKYHFAKLPSFDLSADLDPSQVWYYRHYQPKQTYYPVNDWIGCRRSVEIDVEIQNFHLNNLRQGFFPSLFIALNGGSATEEEREQIYNHLEERFSSTNQAGKLFLTFADDKEHAPEITTLNPTSNGDMFVALNEMVQQNILTGTRISNPTLLGIKTAGQLGSRDEMVDSYEHYLRTVVIPAQEILISEFEKLMFFKTGQPVEIKIEQNKLFDDNTIVDDGTGTPSLT